MRESRLTKFMNEPSRLDRRKWEQLYLAEAAQVATVFGGSHSRTGVLVVNSREQDSLLAEHLAEHFVFWEQHKQP
jgi:hypothetical protein